jgi:hypothetical protein
MRKLIALFVLLITFPACAQSDSNPLRQAAAEGVKSMAWKIKTDGVSICCCNESQSWSDRHGRNAVEHEYVVVIAKMSGQRVVDLKMQEPTCPVKVERLVDATNDQSLDFLFGQLRDADPEGEFLAVIATHDHPRVVPELITLARNDRREDVRKHSLFWLGQKAGEKAASELQHAIDHDPNAEVRQHAVFAISQLPAERSVPILIKLVKTHKSVEVRKKAMFWLTQTGDPRALDLIEEILLGKR